MILAIDPGTNISGWVLFDPPGRIVDCGVFTNSVMLAKVQALAQIQDYMRTRSVDKDYVRTLAIEMVSAMGMPVGKEVFDTVRWIGRFQQAWREPEEVRLIYRRDVKVLLCGSMRAKDPHIRQALIDKIGPVGTAKRQGPLYRVKSHAWQALGVAVTAAETA